MESSKHLYSNAQLHSQYLAINVCTYVTIYTSNCFLVFENALYIIPSEVNLLLSLSEVQNKFKINFLIVRTPEDPDGNSFSSERTCNDAN